MLVLKSIIVCWATSMTTGFVVGPRHPFHLAKTSSLPLFRFSMAKPSQHQGLEPLRAYKNHVDDKETQVFARTWDGATTDSTLELDWVLPDDENSEIRGVVFFLHGFSQAPKAYRPTLEHVSNKLQLAIFAPQVDLDSLQVIEDITQKVGDAPYCVQRALAFDAIQCINMTLNRQPPFSDVLPATALPIGVAGHSMGGGLSWFVSSHFPEEISYVAALAPAPGVSAFAPFNTTAPRQSVHVAGSWDFLAKPSTVQNLTEIANSFRANSSIYVELAKGLHTGFEDDLVIFNVPLQNLFWTFWYLQIFRLFDVFLFKVIIEPLLTSEVQANLTRALLEYTFDSMIQDKPVDVEDLRASLKSSEDVKPKWLDGVTIKQ